MKTLASFVLALALAFPAQIFADASLNSGYYLSKDLKREGGGGAEYISGDYPGAVLMKINLWGAVGKAGIHYVPVRTDLFTLLSYAGGPHTDSALMDEIVIKRKVQGKESVFTVDGDAIIKSTASSPMLEANDVVVVPQRKPLVNSNVFMAFALFSSITSIFLFSLLMYDRFSK